MQNPTSNGYIKLWRKLMDSYMYRQLNSKQRDVMMQCLMLANHEERQWEWKNRIFTARPGQFVTSLDYLKEKCSPDVSIQNIRTAIHKLEKWGFLTNESTKTGRLITIVKWDFYQSKDKQLTNKLTNNQQTANKQLTTNKNVKNDKEYSIASIDARKQAFKDSIAKHLDNYNRELLNDFYLYWTEPNRSNTKLRFELEKTWETSRRLKTWANRAKNQFKTTTTEPSYRKNPVDL